MRALFLITLVVIISGCSTQKRSKSTPQANPKLQNNPSASAQSPRAVDQPPQNNTPAIAKSPVLRAEPPAQDSVRSAPPNTPVVFVPPAKNTPVSAAELQNDGKSVNKPAEIKVPEGKEKAQSKNRLTRDSIELTFEETLTLYQLGGSTLGQNLPLLFTPQLPMGLKIEDYGFELKGSYDKAELTIELGSQPLILIPNIKLELEKPLQSQIKIAGQDFSQFGLCVGSECEVLSLATYQAKERKLVANYPSLFKKVEGQYKPARPMNNKDFQAQYEKLEKEALDPEKMPPQLKVRALFEKNASELESKILQNIRQITKNDKVIYSARLFANLLSGSCDPEFKVDSTNINFDNTCAFINFTHGGKRNSEIFKGPISGEETILKSPAGMQVKVKVIKSATDLVKGYGFYELEYRQPQHQTPISDSLIEAQQNRLCQVLVAKGQTYTHCEFVSSERVFDGLALEGLYDGPLYVKDDNQGKPVILKNRQGLEKARKPEDFKPKNANEATDGQ
ncbi:MAG: hypothetical protein ACK5V3_02080 [Bdellovibrionales bacterium]